LATERTHRLAIDDGSVTTFRTELAAQRDPGSVRYGFSVQDPTYKWDLHVTPGLRAVLKLRSPFVDRDFHVGTLWLDAFRFDPGTLELPRLDGTYRSGTSQDGAKLFIRK
jgi:hypothetical protein